MNKTVLILTGLPGSGKTTAADFFRRKKIPVIRMGDYTDAVLKEENMPLTEGNEKHVRESLRKKYGADIYAKETTEKVNKCLAVQPMVVIDGMRSGEELDYFQKNLPNVKIIFLEAAQNLRYQRLLVRPERPLAYADAKKRDMSELTQLGLYTLRKSADFILGNNGTEADLFKKLEDTLKKISP
ncbi:AAA family ATPase [Candidatus Microgenomates bacterium]|nr:AAA family ATPase [Candidatus Microgenomates bacterium]